MANMDGMNRITVTVLPGGYEPPMAVLRVLLRHTPTIHNRVRYPGGVVDADILAVRSLLAQDEAIAQELEMNDA